MNIYKNYHAFQSEGEYYILDTKRIIPAKITESQFWCFKRLMDEKEAQFDSFPSRFSEIEEFYQQSIFISQNSEYITNAYRELSLSFAPIYACNMRCRYCFSKRKTDYIYTSQTIINDAIEFFDTQFDFRTCRFDFVSGGEPLFDFAHFQKIVEQINTTMKRKQKTSLLWLCTNALELNELQLSYLDENHFNIGISLDGPKNVNDANRVDSYGKGTYNKIVKNITMTMSNENLSRQTKNLVNLAVVTSETSDLSMLLEHSYNIGFRNMQMKLVRTDMSNLKHETKNLIDLYQNFADYLFDKVKQSDLGKIVSICNQNDYFGKILLKLMLQVGIDRRCNAGINKFSISPEGDIYPCDSFVGTEICLGNIYNGFNEKYKLFSSIRNHSLKKCSTCWAMNLCGGDCFYNSYTVNGDFKNPDANFCKLSKSMIMIATRFVVKAYIDYPDVMSKIYKILYKRTVMLE